MIKIKLDKNKSTAYINNYVPEKIKRTIYCTECEIKWEVQGTKYVHPSDEFKCPNKWDFMPFGATHFIREV